MNEPTTLKVEDIDSACNAKFNSTSKPEGRRVIAWFSGGVTSAIACLWALHRFENVDIVFMDTKRNEDPDTYRFLEDCERLLYNRKVKWLSNPNYGSIEQIWEKNLTLNTAHGALCSTELKREMREGYQDVANDYAQIFGFDSSNKREMTRHDNMRRNYPEINVISPNVAFGYSKKKCIQLLEGFGVKVPLAYYWGFMNNNCLESLCVQGGIGYYKKAQQLFPEKFYKMAMREHDFTNRKGKPVTICKDQSKEAKKIGGYIPVFLLPHPDYPNVKDISMFKGRQPEGLMECTGFCGTKN